MQVYETPVVTSEMHGLISSDVESLAYSSRNMYSEGEISNRSVAIMASSYPGLGNNWKGLNVQENRPSSTWAAPSIVVPSNIQGLGSYSGQNMTNSLLVTGVVEGAGSSLDVKGDSTEGASHTDEPDAMQFYLMKPKYPDDHSQASPRTSMMEIHSTSGLASQDFGAQKSLLESHYPIPCLIQTSGSEVSTSILAVRESAHSQWLRGGSASAGTSNDLPDNGNMQHNQILLSEHNNTLNWANRRSGSQTWSREPSSFIENKMAEYLSGRQEAGSGQGLSLSLSYHQPSELHHLQELGNHSNVLQMGPDAKPKSEDLDIFRATHSMPYMSSYSRDEMSTGKGIMNSLHSRPSMMHVNCGAVQGPFLGHASSLKSSVYLRVTQELLYEFCNVGIGATADNNTKRKPSSMNGNFIAGSSGTRTSDFCAKSETGMNQEFYSADRFELQRRKAKLVSMLEEVDRRYKLYRNQMQSISSSFESLTTVGAATPYTSLALKAMSRHFRCLKDAISNQLHITSKSLGENKSLVPGTTRGETPRLGFLERSMRQQRALQQLGMIEQVHPWRPQRGLPERSVSLLRAWLFEHFLHPYPTDTDKHILARQTGLSRSQVSNWFINARVRLWKPMVEEMYLEETKEAKMDSANGKKQQNADEKAKSDQSNSDEKSAFKSGGSDSQYTASEDAAAVFKLQDQSCSTAISQSVHTESFGSMQLNPIPPSHLRHRTDEMKNQDVGLIGESHESLSVMSGSQGDCMRLDQASAYKKIEDEKGFRTEMYRNKLHQAHHDTEIPIDFSSYNITSSNSMAAYSHEQLHPRHFPNSGVSLTLGLHHSGGISFPLGGEDKYDNNIYFSRDDTANQYSMLNNEGNGYMEQGLPYRNYVNGSRLLHDFVG